MRLLVMVLFLVAIKCGAQESQFPPSMKAEPMATQGRYRVTFIFTAPDVSEAFVVGTFNDWNRSQDRMTSAAGGVFTATLEMSEGEHEYSFYIDNRGWRSDPLNPQKIGDAVRGNNSAFRLGAPKDAVFSELEAKARQYVAANSGGDEAKLFPPRTRVEKLEVTTEGVSIELSLEAVQKPWRPDTAQQVMTGFEDALSTKGVSVVIGRRPLSEYITPLYKSPVAAREGPTTAGPVMAAPLRKNVSTPRPKITQGLNERNIVVWGSHGWLYDNRNRKRWEWQRPRLFTTVEDMLPMSIVNQFLLPMLENAGGVVFNCRERDTQVHEVIVDNEDDTSPTVGRFIATGGFKRSDRKGFKNGLAPYADGFMPHQAGVVHESTVREAGLENSVATWIPKIPADGEYAVYVSYAAGDDNVPDAKYIVYHAGGNTTFRVNQQMAGNTWVYLGTFRLKRGRAAKEEAFS